MIERKAEAVWKGTLKDGDGTISLGSGAFSGAYTRASRFEDGEGTNPDELVGAALASCYAMFLSALLSKDDHEPAEIHTTATVFLDPNAGPAVSKIVLETNANVPGLNETDFLEYARKAKENCPISKALAATEIEMVAQLR